MKSQETPRQILPSSPRIAALALALALALAISVQCAPAQQSGLPFVDHQVPPAQVQVGKVDATLISVLPEPSQRILGIKLVIGASGIYQVVSVAPKSEAFDAGLEAGDEILSAQKIDGTIEVIYQRDGTQSSLTLSDPNAPSEAELRLSRKGMPPGLGVQPGGPGKPYVLGVKKTQLLAEQQEQNQRLHRLDPFMAAQAPLMGNATQLQGNATQLQGNATQLQGNATQLQGALNTQQNLPPLAPERARMGNLIASTGKPAFPLSANQVGLSAFNEAPAIKGRATSHVRLLADYDVELIVDGSMSMRQRDCPGYLSRWEWCGIQANSLAKQLAPFVPRGVTITKFASLFDVYPNSSPQKIAELFANPDFHGGTKLAEPLANRLQGFFERRRPGSKPLLIAVITDGVPHPRYEPQAVAETLIEASKRMHSANEVTIVFFQIGGNDMRGREFLSFLDTELTSRGARHDFIHTVSFEHLQRIGLAQALVNSIEEFAVRSTTAQNAPRGK